MVSGSISLRYSGFFSPFLHSTGSLSVSQEYLALPDGPAKFRQGFRPRPTQDTTIYYISLPLRGYHPLWRHFPALPVHICIVNMWSYNPNIAVTTLVWALPRSLATTYGITVCFLLLRVLRCFSSAGLPTYRCTMSST